MPSPSPPTRLAAGTRTSAKPTIGWWWLIVCDVGGRAADTVTPGARQVRPGTWRARRRASPAVSLGLEEGSSRQCCRTCHVPLDAVEDPLVAVAAGGRLDRVDVGARALLGDRVALLALAADRRLEVALDLVRRGHRRAPGRRGRRDPAQRVRHPAHLLLDQDLLQRGAAAAAEVLAACWWRAGRARRPASCAPGVTSSGRPPLSSASTSNGMSSSAKTRARAWMSRSSSDKPYMPAAPPAAIID